MAVADTAKLIVDLSLKGNFARQMGANTKSLDAFVKGENRAFKAGAQIGTGIKNAAKIAAVGVGILVSQVALGLDSLVKLEKATAQTEAVIKSTGGAAGQTAADIRNLAERYEALNATMGDEIIQSGANVLLTFTNIRKKAFEPALVAALDLSTAMGQDLQSSIVQIGKALNDPVRGITALRRVGVSFSKAQEKQIKTLVEQNDLYGAQQVILAELNKEFGGSFLAGGGTTAGKVAKFTDSIEDLQRSLATALLPAVSNIADAFSELLLDPEIVKGTEDLGREIGKLFSKENIQAGAKAVGDAFRTLKSALPGIKSAISTVADVVGTAVRAFRSLPPEIQNLAIAGFAVNKLTGGLVTNIGGGLISAILGQLKSAVVTVHGGVVNVSGPGIGNVTKGAPTPVGGPAGALKLVPAGLIATAIVAAAVPIGEAFADALPASLKGEGGQGMSESQTRITAALNKIAENTKPKPTALPTDRQLDGAAFRNIVSAADKTTTGVENLRRDIGSSLSQTSTKLDAVKTTVASAGIESALVAKNSGMEVKATLNATSAVQAALLGMQTATVLSTGFGTQNAVRSSAAANAASITGAIRANRPNFTAIVNVSATTVTKSTTIIRRYGPGGGSASQPAHDLA